jgi:D-alanyl-D-alanine dipeptidase
MRILRDAAKALTMLVVSGAAAAAQTAPGALPPGFVYLREVAPDIRQDMKYAGTDNFVGRRLPGYEAAECILRRGAAQALAAAQREFTARGYSIKVYDCYRPVRAVRAMATWAHDGRPQDEASRRFNPRIDKSQLFALGYVASRSGHSLGISIDLTIVPLNGAPPAAFDPKAHYADCIGPVAQRAPDDSLDMGTDYDCADVKAHTASRAISAEQRRARDLLVGVLARHGFKNYFREWWHVTYTREPAGTYYDFPIRRPPH